MKYLFFLLFSFPIIINAQELNCTVRINVENLETFYRDFLDDFANSVEDYMNKTKFYVGEWEGERIECSMDIFFTSASNEVNYAAQVVVTSQREIYNSINYTRMLTVSDNSWTFSYKEGQSFYQYETSFDQLTSFLDFYAYVIIGFDLDSYAELGGSPYFSKALNIVNFAVTGGASNSWLSTTGTYSRRKLVQELLDEKYRPFREGFYDYFYGIDVYSQNKKVAQREIVKFVDKVAAIKDKIDIRSMLLKTFFDVKYGEIIEKLKGYQDKRGVLLKLMKIDPAHAAKYDEAI
ncbi:MAG: DUF4835 family protein [Bacteroidetes bacterium]|nr:DUF4835 family protein [Bacteroidota bacterium]